jgi:hypothetical protein
MVIVLREVGYALKGCRELYFEFAKRDIDFGESNSKIFTVK